MKKKMKIFLYVFLCMVLLNIFSISVYAQDIAFDITIPGDTISKRAQKADYEQKFYVTAVTMNKNGKFICESVQLNNKNNYSETVTLEKDKTMSGNGVYFWSAPAGYYYYLQSYSSVSNMHVIGRYTP